LNISAITLGSFCIFFEKLNPILINHERIHVDQIKKIGIFKFYFDYVKQYLNLRVLGFSHYNAYMGISYEKEAYANQDNLDYVVGNK
jgi:hypothetical protein